MASGQAVKVLVATQSGDVYDALRARDGVGFEIALYTGSIKELLPQTQLVIIDYEDIVEYPLSKAEIREAIFGARADECTSADFVADPDKWLSGLVSGKVGAFRHMPERFCVAFVSYSGGIGRTTLALDTALHYASVMKEYRDKRSKQATQSRLLVIKEPALAIEFTYGASSLVSLTGLDMPYLYQLATQPEAVMLEYKGVGLVPMDYENVRMMSVDLLRNFVQEQRALHSLSVIDCLWPHGLITAVSEGVDLWIVVSSARPDAVANARKLSSELGAQFDKSKVWSVLNQNEGPISKAADEISWDIRLPRVSRPDDYRGDLGRAILSKVFAPIWEDYSKPKKPAGRG